MEHTTLAQIMVRNGGRLNFLYGNFMYKNKNILT